MKKKYHGWIYIDRTPGYNDRFSVHITREGKPPLTLGMGYAAAGAAAAVAFFEEAKTQVMDGGTRMTTYDGLNLGRVKLEQTPLGLRVYTEEAEESKSE